MTNSITIIIPTLNEEVYVAGTIRHCFSVASNSSQLEIIVVDAGSTDNTLESISDMNVSSYSFPEFRFKKYLSLNYGMNQAQHDILIFLDADTHLPKNFDLLIIDKLKNKDVIGGAFELAFKSNDWKLKLLQFLNRIRYRFSKLFYGDQAVFCRRSSALAIGGFPPVALMESASFCRNLKKEGKLSVIHQRVLTSPRRFVEHGFFRVLMFDLRMWFRFVFNISVDKFGKKYWRFNLGSNG